MSLDSDWDRVNQNPDNFIVSDVLGDALDFSQFDSPRAAEKQITLPGTIRFASGCISGELLSYFQSIKETRYTFKIKAEDSAIVLSRSELTGLSISDNSNSFTYELEMLPRDEEPEISFELLNPPSLHAILGIVIFR